MDMGICRNCAVKALYWTANHSALAASNWIFDELDRDLDTLLVEELEMIREQLAERERKVHEERKLLSQCHHHHHHQPYRGARQAGPVRRVRGADRHPLGGQRPAHQGSGAHGAQRPAALPDDRG